MTSISIITPWKDHSELIPDYERAVTGAQVIIVDNGSGSEHAAAIEAMAARLGGIYLRNEVNAGFGVANNQGMAYASGDIVMFLNNDIAAEADFLKAVQCDVVAPDVLVGPFMQRHVVYFELKFLEGSCIAGRRQAWDRVGGWDAAAYPGFFWEDVDLSFRAVLAGITLVCVAWPVRHKGHQTALSYWKWGELWEQNRATFAARVRPVYHRLCAENSQEPDQTFLTAKTVAELGRP
jgi:GT2 family glycosyltransferase